jgi:hypothetical protein
MVPEHALLRASASSDEPAMKTGTGGRSGQKDNPQWHISTIAALMIRALL